MLLVKYPCFRANLQRLSESSKKYNYSYNTAHLLYTIATGLQNSFSGHRSIFFSLLNDATDLTTINQCPRVYISLF